MPGGCWACPRGARVPSGPDEIRCFVAIGLPPEAKRGLAELASGLRRGEQRFIKWVDPDGIHLTLKFLGNVSAKNVGGITEAVAGVATAGAPFRLGISGIGAFPSLKQPRVVWVGMNGDLERLELLQQDVESRMARLGFARENRRFAPHLTLARVREGASPEERRAFGELLASSRFEETYDVPVNAISLVRSQLTPAGAIYTRLYEAQLGS